MHKKLNTREKRVQRTMMDFRNLQRGKAAINTQRDASENQKIPQ